MPNPDFLPIEFLVVGGAISGLCSAIALSRHGHKVTVLETDDFVETPLGGGTRLPPNATKVFYRWGMEKRLRQCSVKATGTLFAHYDSGSVVAAHDWEEDVLEETGGDFLLLHYADMRRVLSESALEHGATLRAGAHVVEIHADKSRPYLKLATGEVVTADVIIGADGSFHGHRLCRSYLLKAQTQREEVRYLGQQTFHALVPASSLNKVATSLLTQLQNNGKVFAWYGPSYGALGFPVKDPKTRETVFTLYIYVKYEGPYPREPELTRPSAEELVRALGKCDPRLISLAQGATYIARLPLLERSFLEDWTHPLRRVLVIGDAAHPLPPGSLYSLGMAVGDAAFLGQLFSHLHTYDQIDRFLGAVQEMRLERVKKVLSACEGNIFAIALPPGVAEARNRTLRERTERGIEELRGGVRQTREDFIEAIEGIFAYEPEDEAESWWVQWGLTQERAARIFSSEPIDIEVAQTLHS